MVEAIRLNTAKARKRLDQAQQFFSQLDPNSFRAFEDAWSNFLIHANGVYVQLEQASKVSPRAQQWFGAKKRERREDELLQYLHQARNSDEHSVESVTARDPGHLAIGKAAPGYSSSMTINTLPDGRLHVESTDGMPILVEVAPPSIKLRPVTGRGFVVFNPPSQHLGQELDDRSPVAVASKALQFLSDLLDEAERFFA